MAEKRIVDLFEIKSRFLRSAHLERDFNDPGALAGYVPTEFIQSCLDRIGEGLRSGSGQRAWRVTGDYGSGKSSFGLLLAHALAGRDSTFPPQLRRVVDFRRQGASRPEFLPVLVTCAREPLGTSILRGVHRSLAGLYGRGAKAGPAGRIHRLLSATPEPSEEQIVEAILEANSQLIADSKAQGLLLLMDELGKFLEFAALHPHRQDVFLLQRLAEVASRSAGEPLFVVGLLHQGFNAYADHLNQAAQREWEKVAGRFDEIVFDQPLEQLGHLIAAALNVRVDQLPKPQALAARQAMGEALELGWFGAARSQREALLALAPRLYPLHPTVLPVLIRVFKRFGQNERSLFSFLLSNEPFGLQSFSGLRLSEARPYRLHDLFDYVRTNFGHRLAAQSYRSHWALIESVIENYATEEPLQVQVLKTVGLLNLLKDDLLPNGEAVGCALAGDDHALRPRVKAALDKLRTVKRALYDRGRSRGLCLWPHTSVDLEQAYEEARRAVELPKTVAPCIKDHLQTRPIVGRRHYIETGNLRHFDVRYCAVSELAGPLDGSVTDADGLILVPLCETVTERDLALEFAKSHALRQRPNWLMAVPQPLSNLAGLVQEFQRWEWVATNTLELNGDQYAREELSRQRTAVRMQLEAGIEARVGFRQIGGPTSPEWFRQGQPLPIRDGRQLLSELSRILDETYPEAPRIHNELVNRRALSSAAAAARMRLIERMFSDGKSDCLGMDHGKKPPEMSMYLSVLRSTGLHQELNGVWRITEPHPRTDEKCRVLPTLRRIREIVQRQPDSRVNIATLFAELRQPPFGVRDGLISIFLTVFAIVHDQDVAFYRDGTFLRELGGETLLLLTKAPERFDIQYCRIEGVRAELFERLLAVLEVKPAEDRRAELLDVVKNLCVFVAQLPAYVLNTKRLSPTAVAVRDTILNAREPARLLFRDLPKACGFDPITVEAAAGKPVQTFVKSLKAALDDLRVAFPEMQERLRQQLRAVFDPPGTFPQFRTALAARAEQVVLGVTEPKLRAFCLRLMDDHLPESDWLESLGSYLALKPPSKWQDAEADLFSTELAQLAARFHRVESIAFAGGHSPKNAVGVRLAITKANGLEHERVVHVTAEEEDRLRELQSQFERVLSTNPRLGLAAASRALWASLEKGGKPER